MFAGVLALPGEGEKKIWWLNAGWGCSHLKVIQRERWAEVLNTFTFSPPHAKQLIYLPQWLVTNNTAGHTGNSQNLCASYSHLGVFLAPDESELKS